MNKQIEHISYNVLNLPNRIKLAQEEYKYIDYTYTSNGTKLQKRTWANSAPTTTTDYVGSFVFKNSTLDYVLMPEGRIEATANGDFSYNYFLKDHLGNTRVVFSETGEVLQDESYYPFGMSLGNALTYSQPAAKENKYLYNGKELQSDFGLEWYDYGFRFYDAQLGRWHVADPLTEETYSWSPYCYGYSSPLVFTDPDGLYALFVNGTEADNRYVDPITMMYLPNRYKLNSNGEGPIDFMKALAASVDAAFTIGVQGGVEVKVAGRPAIALYGNAGNKDLIGVRGGDLTHIAQENSPTRYGTSLGLGSFGTSNEAEIVKTTETEMCTIPGTNGKKPVRIDVEKGTKTTSISAFGFAVGGTQTAEIRTNKSTGMKGIKTTKPSLSTVKIDIDSKLDIKTSAIIGIDVSIDLRKVLKSFDELNK